MSSFGDATITPLHPSLVTAQRDGVFLLPHRATAAGCSVREVPSPAQELEREPDVQELSCARNALPLQRQDACGREGGMCAVRVAAAEAELGTARGGAEPLSVR